MILQYFHFSLEHFMVIFGQVFCGVQPGCTCFNLWIHGVRRNLEKKIEGESRNAAKRRLTVSFYGKLKLMFLTSNAVPVSFLYRIVENRAGLKGIMGGRGEPPLKTSQYFIRLGKTTTLIFLAAQKVNILKVGFFIPTWGPLSCFNSLLLGTRPFIQTHSDTLWSYYYKYEN